MIDVAQAMKRHFDVLDVDRDGHITFHELQKAFTNANARVSPAIVMELIREVDINRNGTIEFDEFLRVRNN